MTISADPDQLASSEANWSGSILFAKTEHVVFSKRRVKPVLLARSQNSNTALNISKCSNRIGTRSQIQPLIASLISTCFDMFSANGVNHYCLLSVVCSKVRQQTPNEDSNQLGHLCSLISRRCPREEILHPYLSGMRPVKILIRLRERSGWSESSLGAHI